MCYIGTLVVRCFRLELLNLSFGFDSNAYYVAYLLLVSNGSLICAVVGFGKKRGPNSSEK
jgi:hypothetical protein